MFNPVSIYLARTRREDWVMSFAQHVTGLTSNQLLPLACLSHEQFQIGRMNCLFGIECLHGLLFDVFDDEDLLQRLSIVGSDVQVHHAGILDGDARFAHPSCN